VCTTAVLSQPRVMSLLWLASHEPLVNRFAVFDAASAIALYASCVGMQSWHDKGGVSRAA
jgi:hypothetical protein